MKSPFGKTVFAGLFVSLTCALMACSSAEGPTETASSDTATTSSESSANYYYICNGTHNPCSEDVYNSASHVESATAGCYTVECYIGECSCPWQSQTGYACTNKN